MNNNENSINWFEIPTTNIERAKTFYETLFQIKMEIQPMMLDTKMAFFPYDDKSDSGKVSGAIVQREGYVPSQDGVVIYLNGNPDLQIFLDHVEEAQGKVVMPKTLITLGIGYMAFFIDTEGNKIALHSQK